MIRVLIRKKKTDREGSDLFFSQIKKEIPDVLPKIYADPDKIIQIFTNLIGNAIKFIAGKGKICISAWVPNSSQPAYLLEENKGKKHIKYIEVCVSDTGVGIPPDEIDSIFDKFHLVSKH